MAHAWYDVTIVRSTREEIIRAAERLEREDMRKMKRKQMYADRKQGELHRTSQNHLA